MDTRLLWITSLWEDSFVSVKPNTSTWMTRQAGCNWDVCAGRRVELLLVSISPPLARYLIHDTTPPHPPLTPPPSSSSSLCLSVGHSAVISYTVCTFDQRPWIMVFRFFKVAWIRARAENGKQTRVHHPLFLLNSNVSWLFRFSENSVMLFHVRLPSLNGCAGRAWVCFITGCLYVMPSNMEESLISSRESSGMLQETC